MGVRCGLSLREDKALYPLLLLLMKQCEILPAYIKTITNINIFKIVGHDKIQVIQ